MSNEAQKLGTVYHVLSVTLGADGTTTLTLDADVSGTRQIVHHPGGPLTYEIAQLMQENFALKAKVAELQAECDSRAQDDLAMTEKVENIKVFEAEE